VPRAVCVRPWGGGGGVGARPPAGRGDEGAGLAFSCGRRVGGARGNGLIVVF
jgi:hypothetical protein